MIMFSEHVFQILLYAYKNSIYILVIFTCPKAIGHQLPDMFVEDASCVVIIFSEILKTALIFTNLQAANCP